MATTTPIPNSRTSPLDEINAIVNQYGASYNKTAFDSAAGYLINHSLYGYLIDRRGAVRALLKPEHPPETIAILTRKLLP